MFYLWHVYVKGKHVGYVVYRYSFWTYEALIYSWRKMEEWDKKCKRIKGGERRWGSLQRQRKGLVVYMHVK